MTDNTKPPTLGFLFTLACCSQLMERYNIERGSPQRERSEDREEPRSHFDYRHLIPQVSIKTEELLIIATEKIISSAFALSPVGG